MTSMKAIPLISRKILFGNPDKTSVQLSPDGMHLAYLAPRDGVLNVWVSPRDNSDMAKPVTHDTGCGIRFYVWAYTNRHILYLQDEEGDENWRVYRVNLHAEAKNLTPFNQVKARLMEISPFFPEEIIVGLNNRNPQWHDIYRINLCSGTMTLLEQNDKYADYMVDDHFRLLMAFQMTPDGGMAVFKQRDEGEWEPWNLIPAEDMLTTNPVGINKDGNVVFMKDSRGRNTSALQAHSLNKKQVTLLAEDSLADAHNVICHPTEKHVQAVSFVHERKRWQILDQSIETDLDYLRTVADGEVEIVNRTLNDEFWIVLYVLDNGPTRFYIYDRKQHVARFLFTNRQALESQPLVKMHSAVIQSRDGLNLVLYYSLPSGSDSDDDGIPDQPIAMVFTPHGGPWGRDFWGYDSWHQWLANRGYAVLCVNFRSSTGFGKAFINAGDRQWGGKIIEDQIDAVQWAIAQGIADPQKVGVMGGSFGGYSTLAGLTFTPGTYACGVDLVGPSNLITLLETMPPYWKPVFELFTTRVGDLRTEEGRALLTKHSPLTYVDRISRPLLIGQGANDPRVKQAESEQIVNAMQDKHLPVTYVLYPDEGHGFARPENRLSFFAIAEAFLAKCLGGRCEPIGDDFKGSSLKVITGIDEVRGLTEALSSQSG
jgi:dipeptidyl aminopeptidase/acylaminoacyl peptidase